MLLFNLLKGESKRSKKTIEWTQELNKCFINSKKLLSEETSRVQPDKSKEFILITDASEKALGAILAQVDEKGQEKMIYAWS